ncbi:MAG: sigma-54 dependent transcriptional regulator [Pseudohongiellaceae bacterium]
MAGTPRILLIEDNDKARRELEVILHFLGESVVASTSTGWREALESVPDTADISATGTISTVPNASAIPAIPGNIANTTSNTEVPIVLIGSCDSTELTELLAELHSWSAGVPSIVLGEGRIAADLKPRLASQVVASPGTPLAYQPLLDALHKARVFYEHYNRLRDVGGVRDYNMFRSLVGTSAAIEQVRYMMGQVANTEISVLITGESGTGKEVVARNLHLNSARADKPFIPINCGAIPAELLESELFGHEKGAFTGAVSSRAGRFELADGGTLFLDEIGDMPLSMQVKLLRVLQERSFERVGGVKTLHTDVRIMAATHRDLQQMIAGSEFRQDLYYRINVFPIDMPPLRGRSEDIPPLINDLISTMEASNRGSVRFNSNAIVALGRYHWPGNVRELANLIERMAILHPHRIVGFNDLPAKFQSPARPLAPGQQEAAARYADGSAGSAVDNLTDSSALEAANIQRDGSAKLLPMKGGLDLKEYLANLEKNLIEKALSDSDGVVTRAADRLHMRRTTLVEKMRKYNLQKNPG